MWVKKFTPYIVKTALEATSVRIKNTERLVVECIKV